MDITLEKIELVKDRTGASYKEAKEALEATNGDVVDAIIKLEEDMDNFQAERTDVKAKSKKVVEHIKEVVSKGNIARIVVKKDGESMLNLPLNAGLIGAVVAPWGMLVAVIAAFGTRCEIELVKTDGTIIDVSNIATETFESAVEKGSNIFEEAKSRGVDAYDTAKDAVENIYRKARFGSGSCDGDCDFCTECETCPHAEECEAEDTCMDCESCSPEDCASCEHCSGECIDLEKCEDLEKEDK